MRDEVAIIDSLAYEDEVLKNHCKRVAKLLKEQEAIFLEKRSQLASMLPEEWARQMLNLKQAFITLEESLTGHKKIHDEIPTSLIGAVLSNALKIEHDGVMRAIRKVEAEISVDNRGLTREEMLTTSFRIRSACDSACVLVEAHLNSQEAILGLLRKGLKAKGETGHDGTD